MNNLGTSFGGKKPLHKPPQQHQQLLSLSSAFDPPEIQLGMLVSLARHSHNRNPPAGTAPPSGDCTAVMLQGDGVAAVVKHQRTAPQEHAVSWSELYEPRTSMGAGRSGVGQPGGARLAAFLARADGARLRLG